MLGTDLPMVDPHPNTRMGCEQIGRVLGPHSITLPPTKLEPLTGYLQYQSSSKGASVSCSVAAGMVYTDSDS